jgi:hypothetical protein
VGPPQRNGGFVIHEQHRTTSLRRGGRTWQPSTRLKCHGGSAPWWGRGWLQCFCWRGARVARAVRQRVTTRVRNADCVWLPSAGGAVGRWQASQKPGPTACRCQVTGDKARSSATLPGHGQVEDEAAALHGVWMLVPASPAGGKSAEDMRRGSVSGVTAAEARAQASLARAGGASRR